jgi:hypothetical protein
LTLAQLIERAKRQLAGRVPQDFPLREADVELMAAALNAFHEFALRCANDPAKRGLQSQEYSVSIGADGSGAHTSATGSITSAADIVTETIALGTVADADGNLLSYVPDFAAFRYQPPTTALALYSLKNGKLWTSAKDIDNDSRYTYYSGATVTVTACWSPSASTLSFLKTELEDELVSCVVDVFLRQAIPAKK